MKTFEDRLLLWRQYQSLQVYNAIAIDWIKLMVVPTIFSLSIAIIACLFISIRHAELPILTYLMFPYTGVSLLILLFWICFEVIKIIRASEEIIVKLGTRECGTGNTMTKLEMLYIQKKSKATRALGYRMGNFGYFSLDVPVGTWDEILNQLFFLLTY